MTKPTYKHLLGAYLKDNNKVLWAHDVLFCIYHSDGFYISACIIIVILDVMIQNHSIFLYIISTGFTMASKPCHQNRKEQKFLREPSGTPPGLLKVTQKWM